MGILQEVRDLLGAPCNKAAVISPHDTNALANPTRGLYIGGAGNIAVRLEGDSADVLFSGVPAGTILPVIATHVRSTLTTATLIVGMF